MPPKPPQTYKPRKTYGPCPGIDGTGCPDRRQLSQPTAQFCRGCFHAFKAATRRAPQRGVRAPLPTDTVERAARRAEGIETVEDRLRRENVELRAASKQAAAVIKRYEDRGAFEDRVASLFTELLQSRRTYTPQLTERPTIAKGGKARAHEMLVLVSDAHYPEVVEPEATFGLTYNAAVCRARIEYLRDTIVRYRDLRAESYPVQKLTIAVLGDMLSGDIHEELEVTNELPLSEALVGMGDMLYDFGRTLAAVFPDVEMIVLPGNHPRITKKPRYKQKWNNWEHVMGLYVQALAGTQFAVKVPKDLVYRHRIFNKVVALSHGDGIKSNSFAGIPWYAMKQRQDALQALLRSLREDQIDLLCYAHFHQLIFQEGQGSSLIINGSIKGGDEYSVASRYANQEPVQALITFHPEHGITDLSRINLGHIR